MTGPKRVTEKQLAANRANAQHSTGPRTPEGKAISSQNALTHGILARAVIPRALQPYESQADFERFLAALTEAYAPADITEALLVEQIAATYWRLARLYRAEAGNIAMRHRTVTHAIGLRRPSPILESLLPVDPNSTEGLRRQRETLHNLLNDEATLRTQMVTCDPSLEHITDEQLIKRVHTTIAEIEQELSKRERQEQDEQEALWSLPAPDTALKFARYETMLQRQLDRALSRLERFQRHRGGEFVTPPVELTVAGVDLPDQ